MTHRPKPLAVTINEACRLTSLGRTSLYSLISEGTLESITVGRRRLVRYASLEALIGAIELGADARGGP